MDVYGSYKPRTRNCGEHHCALEGYGRGWKRLGSQRVQLSNMRIVGYSKVEGDDWVDIEQGCAPQL